MAVVDKIAATAPFFEPVCSAMLSRMDLYPLKFKPRLLEKMWGGRKLQTVLNKPLPPGVSVGESWELYDFPPSVLDGEAGWVSSEVANGPFAGQTLHELIGRFGDALHGALPLTPPHGQFPILIKFLDAAENLSIQVHPDAEYARSHPEAHLKTEAWYVLQHDPDARIYKGLTPGTTRADFEQAIAQGAVPQRIQQLAVKDGQCHFMPSGTVHALGAGILAYEVQTASDTTFRVYDFDRADPATGKPRKLHIQQALDCIDFGPPVPTPPRSHVGSVFTTVTQLANSPYFVLEKVRFTAGVEEAIPYDQPVVWTMLEGHAEIHVKEAEPTTLRAGETLLLPARLKSPTIRTYTDCVWLEVTFPQARPDGAR